MGELQSAKIAKTVDVRGQICPYPIIETRKTIKELTTGDVFEVFAAFQTLAECRAIKTEVGG